MEIIPTRASATPALEAPQITVRNASYNSVTITWNQISGAHGYKVYRSTKRTAAIELLRQSMIKRRLPVQIKIVGRNEVLL